MILDASFCHELFHVYVDVLLPEHLHKCSFTFSNIIFSRTFAETALFCEQFIEQGVYQPGDRFDF